MASTPDGERDELSHPTTGEHVVLSEAGCPQHPHAQSTRAVYFRVSRHLSPYAYRQLTRVFDQAGQRCHRELDTRPGTIEFKDYITRRVDRFHFDSCWESLRYTTSERMVLVGRAEFADGTIIDAELMSVPDPLTLRPRLNTRN